MTLNTPLIIALDYDNLEDCLNLARQLSPQECRLKVGKELFTSQGPRVVESLSSLGFEIFLDLKFHDIPNTVAKTMKVVANLGVWMVNVHACGGEAMMRAAQEALEAVNGDSCPKLIAVTVLTSFSESELHATGVGISLTEQVLNLSLLAQACGLNGVVCSAHEAKTLKEQCGQAFELVTPGIRLNSHSNDDQTRIMTPKEAMQAGSDYLVVGRPVTQAEDPGVACNQILTSLRRSKSLSSDSSPFDQMRHKGTKV